MTKRFLLILLAMYAMSVGLCRAQIYPTPKLYLNPSNPLDTLPNDSVFFSEILDPNWSTWGFLEVTNNSSRTVKLSHFFIQSFNQLYSAIPFIGSDYKINLRGDLAPGQSYVINITQFNTSIDAYGKPVYKNYILGPEEAIAKADTVFAQLSNLRPLRYVMYSRYINKQAADRVDSAIVDVFNPEANKAISGLPLPADQPAWNFVRKTMVKKSTSLLGSVAANTYWDKVRGTSTEDSEWLPVPLTYMRPQYCVPFTSYGHHGVSNINSIKSKGKAIIDTVAKTITFPYNISRDSVFREFKCDANVTWHFKVGHDTTKYFVQNNDTVIFYLLGNKVREVKFVTIVSPTPSNSAEITPLQYFNNSHVLTKRYVVSQNHLPMDTIGNVPYTVSIDTLLAYLVFPEGSNYSVIHPNNVENPDVMAGSVIKVVSADKSTTKTYKIGMMPYNPSHVASVKAIVFPGMQLWSNKNYEPTDTFALFNPNNTEYKIQLPDDTQTIPAVVVVAQNGNANINIVRAKSLNGLVADRTMHITCTAEDDTTKITYNITFELKHEEPALEYAPFFCDLGSCWGQVQNYTTQIYNPSDETLDFSEYVIGMIDKRDMKSLIGMSTLSATINWIKYDQQLLRPGYIVVNNTEGKPVYTQDLIQNVTTIKPKNCFTITSYRDYPFETYGSSKALCEQIDFVVYQNYFRSATLLGPTKDFWGFGWTYGLAGRYTGTGAGTKNYEAGSVVLFKIKNDSVKDGIKAMNDFVNDYEIVDIVNDVNSVLTPWKIYDRANGVDRVLLPPTKNEWNLYRKPSIYKGNPIGLASFGFGDDVNVVQPSEWVVYGYPGAGKNLLAADSPAAVKEAQAIGRTRFKNHKMFVTVHLAYLLSGKYIVSNGLDGQQTIDGVLPNTTVSDFAKNIILVDSGITYTLKSSTGTLKTGSDQIVTGDIVTTTSVRGTDHVIYKISVEPLNNDALIKSTVYAVVKNGTTGTISNVPFGTTLKELMSQITVPALAKAIPLDANDMIMSELSLPTDSVKMRAGERTNTILAAGNSIEVTAQNGDVCNYAITFIKPATPLVTSDVFSIDQSAKTINNALTSSVKTFIGRLKTAPGFKIKIVNKIGQDRPDGTVRYDDRVIVYDETNAANATTYYINYYGEVLFDAIPSNTSANINASVYPNPTSNSVVVKANGLSKVSVSDITGRTIFTKIATGNSLTVTLPKTNGIYLVKADANGQSETIKVLKH